MKPIYVLPMQGLAIIFRHCADAEAYADHLRAKGLRAEVECRVLDRGSPLLEILPTDRGTCWTCDFISETHVKRHGCEPIPL